MEDLKYRYNHKIDGYLTAEQETDILALRDTPNGKTLDLPTDYPMFERQRFEQIVFPSISSKIELSLASSLIPLVIAGLHLHYKSFPSFSLLVTEIIFGALVAASVGNGHLKMKNDEIIRTRKIHDARVDRYENNIQRAADEAIRVNLVKDADEDVSSGHTISMVQLAKLVDFDDHHFYQACDKLAITVLQAKAAVLMGKGLVKEFNIATYYSCDLVVAPLNPISTHEGITHEKLLRLALEHQFNNLTHLKAKTDEDGAEQKSAVTTAEEPPQKSGIIMAVFNWFANGFKANVDVWRKVSANDYLPETKTAALTVAEIPYYPNFGEILKSHHNKIWRPNDNKYDYLDLPALNGAGLQLRAE